MKYDYVVVGGGMSGMTSAIILSQKGYRVALIEKSRYLSPTVRGFFRHDVYFDTGFHYTGGCGTGEPLDLFFRYLGISERILKIRLNHDGFDIFRMHKPAFEFQFPCGINTFLERLSETFPGEREAIGRYLSEMMKAYLRLPYINLDAEMTGEVLPFSAHEKTLAELLDEITDNRILKTVLSAHCLLHGVSAREVPITNHACVAVPYYQSACTIQGGGLSLVKSFEDRLSELAVDTYCGTGVSGFEQNSTGSISAVRTDKNELIQCDGAIVTIHPKKMLSIIPDEAFRRTYRSRISTAEDTSSACILFGTCKSPVQTLSHSNILFFDSPDISDLGRTTDIHRAPLFISGTRHKSSHSSSDGFIAICPVSNTEDPAWNTIDPGQYRGWKDSMTRELTRYIEQSIPELTNNIANTELASPFTVARYTHNPAGSLYGLKHKSGQYNPMPTTKIRNLFLAGQGITAPGILGTTISAFITCGFIVGHDTLRKELRACA